MQEMKRNEQSHNQYVRTRQVRISENLTEPGQTLRLLHAVTIWTTVYLCSANTNTKKMPDVNIM
jgi:hypothetical protein